MKAPIKYPDDPKMQESYEEGWNSAPSPETLELMEMFNML